MKKYKLIKSYPTCRWEIGDIITLDNGYYKGKGWNFYESPSEYPEFWEEVKKPLLTTEDGIIVFENDLVHWVRTDNIVYLYEWKIFKTHLTILGGETIYKIFAKKENAEKYILESKKMYTLEDMVRIANYFAYIKSVTPEVAQKVIDKWTNS